MNPERLKSETKRPFEESLQSVYIKSDFGNLTLS